MYEGRQVIGRPKLTVLRGRVIAEDGRPVGSGGGSYVDTGDAIPIAV
jgi:hypothetical protein